MEDKKKKKIVAVKKCNKKLKNRVLGVLAAIAVAGTFTYVEIVTNTDEYKSGSEIGRIEEEFYFSAAGQAKAYECHYAAEEAGIRNFNGDKEDVLDYYVAVDNYSEGRVKELFYVKYKNTSDDTEVLPLGVTWAELKDALGNDNVRIRK